MKAPLVVITIAVIVYISTAKQCLNNCSGNGICKKDGKCLCLPQFSGADCSEWAFVQLNKRVILISYNIYFLNLPMPIGVDQCFHHNKCSNNGGE